MSTDSIFRLLLWAVVVNAALLLLVLWRRGLAGQRGYALLLFADLLLAVALLAANLHDHPLAMVTVGAFVFLVVVPLVLQSVGAWAVRHGRWGLAMRLTSLRELLQPGAGIGREKQLLTFLRKVQTGDTQEFLSRLKEETQREQDPEVLGMLHEQILTLLALDRRWEEAEAWAEGKVTPAMVATRPRLGSALIRVHGERGHLDAVVRVMYLVEGGSGAGDPEAVEVIHHCRIMVLAFTGHAQVLERVLARSDVPPMHAKVGAFWLGVAWHQAGDVARAREWFLRAESLLEAGDDRAREALAARRAQLVAGASPVVLPDPDLTKRLVEAVEDRTRAQQDRQALRPGALRRTPVTLLLVGVNVLFYVVVFWVGNEADANRRLILAGASLKGAVDAGEYWRLVSAMFLHAGLFHVLLNTFMLWFVARFAEQLLGSMRFFVVYFGAGLVGNLASHLQRDYPVSVGASSSIFGVLGATLAALILARGSVPEGWRRFMLFVLFAVIGLSFLPGLDVKQIDNSAHVGGLVGGALLAALLLVASRRSWGRLLGQGLALVFVGTLLYTAHGLVTSDLETLRWGRSERAGMRVSHPVSWFSAAGSEPGQLVLFHIFDDDRIRVTRGAGRLEAPAEWQKAQLLELREKTRSSSSGGGRYAVRALAPGTLPEPWRAVQVRQTRPDGRARMLVLAYGHPTGDAGRAWMVELLTEPARTERLLRLLSGVLSRLRSL